MIRQEQFQKSRGPETLPYGRGSAWAALLGLATRAEVSASLGYHDSADRIAGEAHPRLNIPVREVEVIRGRGSAWAALLSLATRAEVSASLGDDDTADRIAAMLAGLALLAVDPVEFLEAAWLAGGIHIV